MNTNISEENEPTLKKYCMPSVILSRATTSELLDKNTIQQNQFKKKTYYY